MGLFERIWKRPARGAADPKSLFAEELAERLRAQPGVSQVSRLPEQFTLAVKRGEEEMRAFLDNLWAETREVAPAERERMIERFIATIVAISDDEVPW